MATQTVTVEQKTVLLRLRVPEEEAKEADEAAMPTDEATAALEEIQAKMAAQFSLVQATVDEMNAGRAELDTKIVELCDTEERVRGKLVRFVQKSKAFNAKRKSEEAERRELAAKGHRV